ncbi:hypothetical protein ACHAXS_005539 [Conticribra weissflogii]
MKWRKHRSAATYFVVNLIVSLIPVIVSAANDDGGNTVLGGFGGGSGGTGSANGFSGCRLIVERNEWAAGCIPAVNFVVRLVDCGEGVAMNDITIRFIDENDKELGRDYFVTPPGQCTVTGYGNIKTITPRGGNQVFLVANCDLCGTSGVGSINRNAVGGFGTVVTTASSVPVAVAGQVTDCF